MNSNDNHCFRAKKSHDQCYYRVRIQQFSELKQLLSELRISGHYWKCLRTAEYLWKCLSITEHLWKSLKIIENVWELLWTFLKRPKHRWTTRKISARLWKCRNITENYYFNSETVLKPLLMLFIAEGSSTYVLSSFYELHVRKIPKEKENKLKIRTKWNTVQTKIYNSEHCIAFGVIPEMGLDVILHRSLLPSPPPPQMGLGTEPWDVIPLRRRDWWILNKAESALKVTDFLCDHFWKILIQLWT